MVGCRIQHKVSGIAGGDTQGVGSEQLIGYFYRKGGRYFNIEDKVAGDIEDATRFVCQVLNYNPREVWQMNVYEFYRDLMRANVIMEQRKSQIKKWQSK